MISINICNDFSDTPGGRYIREGDFSGEAFRDQLLIKKYEEAESKNDTLCIDFDGTYGYGSSFLEEAFGGLVRKYRKKDVLKHISLVSTEDETIPELVEKYVKEAEANLR